MITQQYFFDFIFHFTRNYLQMFIYNKIYISLQGQLMTSKKIFVIFTIFLLLNFYPAMGSTYETSKDQESFGGYTLFAPMALSTTYLIDNEGDVVHTWASNFNSLAVYLLDNFNLLRTNNIGNNSVFIGAGATGRIELLNWDGDVIWDYEYSSNQYCSHHDIELMPNGHILMIAWEYKSASEALTAGRDPLLSNTAMWPGHVIEVQPTGNSGGNIIWEWHVWDHLIQDYDPVQENFGDVANHPELIDINFVGGRELNHMNAIDYNEELDQIMLSVNKFSEIWIIDHSTTTAEAAGHTGGNSGMGGDILYRWGNPQAYLAGSTSDRKFYNNHDAQWIEKGCPGEGNILVFNNGYNRPEGDFSSIDEIVPPITENGTYAHTPGSAYGPTTQKWIYTSENQTDFFSSGISGAQRLPNGNTLICEGIPGTFFEVTEDKRVVWEYINPYPTPGAMVFKIRRYNLLFDPLVSELSTNWNLISLPFAKSIDKTNLIINTSGVEYSWSDAVNEGIVSDYIFGWDRSGQSYIIDNVLKPGFGYWFYSFERCELRVENLNVKPRDNITEVESSWNLVSIPETKSLDKTEILVNDINWSDAISAGLVNNYIFSWNRSGQFYEFCDTLEPGQSYWLFASQACLLKRGN